MMAENPTGRSYGVLYLIGPDRVGILHEAASFVSQRGGRIEEGISHTLSTEAAIVLYISGTPPQLEQIKQATQRLGEGLEMLAIYTGIAAADPARDRDALPLTLRISSPDFSGLLTAVTRFFTKYGLSIIDHHLHKSILPHSNGMVTYRHKFTVLLPPEFKRKQFLAELDELAEKESFIRDDISHSDFY